MPQVTLGDARNKTKVVENGIERYHCDVPIIVNGTERGVLNLNIAIPEAKTNAEVAAWLASGLRVEWNC